jgi:alkylation response protein AidB-like acyl-CoA dehydrogenase
MATYTPPLRDMQFVLHELLQVQNEYKQMPAHQDTDADTINAVLEEGGKFAAEVIFPLNQSGDREGCKLDKTTHEVTPPKGFKEAYKTYCEGGWAALSCDPEYGGQGLPIAVNQAFYEMLNSANQAWTMYPGLTHGAYECLHEHGTPEQKATYLPKLVSGEWTGTMCLTEPHCGTDLGMLRTKAEPQADGTYKITGGKIFISSGSAQRHQRHQLVCGAQVHGERRRQLGRTQRHLLLGPRTQNGHPRQRHGANDARRRCGHARG